MSLYRPYQKCLPHPFPLTLPILSGYNYNTYSSRVWAIIEKCLPHLLPLYAVPILNDYNTYMYGSCVHVCAIRKRAVVAVVSLINPLSPNIHIQILQTDLHTFPLRITWEKKFNKTSRHFLFCDHFLYSHNLISWQCMDIVRRKLLLVTIGT